jgi:hypothetical protein
VKQVLAGILARFGAIATRGLAARLEAVATRFDEVAVGVQAMQAPLDRAAERLDAIERSLGALHRAVEDLAAIPALSTELVDGIADAEARATARLAEVERLLAGR